jgi:hypothetical protein
MNASSQTQPNCPFLPSRTATVKPRIRPVCYRSFSLDDSHLHENGDKQRVKLAVAGHALIKHAVSNLTPVIQKALKTVTRSYNVSFILHTFLFSVISQNCVWNLEKEMRNDASVKSKKKKKSKKDRFTM